MPLNTAITSRLVAGEVPPDLECQVQNMSAITAVIEQVMSVQSSSPDSAQSQTDSTADLALNTANTALAQVSSLQASIPQRRTSGSSLVPIAGSGDTNVSLSLVPEMPNTNYQVNVAIHGPSTANSGPDWIVVNNSRTVGSVQLRFLNCPAGSWSFSWEVVAL